MSNPSHVRYTKEHEWLEISGSEARVGLTAYAADALGDVVYVQLPEVGTTIVTGEACGEVESTKSVSDVYAPADGVVIEVNEAAVEEPSLINLRPFSDGWLFRMRVTRVPDLLDSAEYDQLTGGH